MLIPPLQFGLLLVRVRMPLLVALPLFESQRLPGPEITPERVMFGARRLLPAELLKPRMPWRLTAPPIFTCRPMPLAPAVPSVVMSSVPPVKLATPTFSAVLDRFWSATAKVTVPPPDMYSVRVAVGLPMAPDVEKVRLPPTS